MRARFVAYSLVCACLLSLPSANAFAGSSGREVRQCGTLFDNQYSPTLGETGGVHITSKGLLRILVVFASFPDDTTPHPFWPAHNPPLSIERFIDPDTTTRSQDSFNLTNYFRQMSLGQFHVVGEAVWVEAAHSQEEYRNGSYGRANTDVLRERVDSLVDFSLYDQWTKQADYTHANMPDGQVDMIVMVWRTNMFEYFGEASLGYKAAVLADGKRIEMGYPERLQFPLGSGVTCEYVYTDTPYKAMQTMAHELGHWLLGGRHPYNGTSLHGKHAYWGILCNGQRVASCANAYEREKLGWIEVPEIPPDSDIPLTDYLSSGVAYKYHPENGWPSEFFYIENHQRLSVLDDITTNPEDKGIWVLHQQGPYMELDNLRIRPSDGNWGWENPGVVRLCFSQELPVFERGVPMTLTGVTHRDQIPTRTSAVNWMFVYKDPTGQLNCGAFFTGQMFDGAFEPNVHAVFSPYSNPSSDTWEGQPNPFSLEILSELNGVLTIRYHSDPLDAAPARRYLGLDPTAGESKQGLLSLAWGTQWVEAQRLEADVNGSELQRQIGNGGSWSSVYQGAMTDWRDSSLTYDTNGTVPVLFRVRLRDTQGKYSPWSNIFYTTVVGANAVGGETNKCDEIPSRFGLSANFPNPFNPSTMIEFTLGSSAEVTLKLYNLVGEEVKTIISGQRLSAGLHSVLVTADDLASGVYLYRLVTPEFSQTRKMVLLR